MNESALHAAVAHFLLRAASKAAAAAAAAAAACVSVHAFLLDETAELTH